MRLPLGDFSLKYSPKHTSLVKFSHTGTDICSRGKFAFSFIQIHHVKSLFHLSQCLQGNVDAFRILTGVQMRFSFTTGVL